ncbi:lipase [Nocardia sp. NPDC050710]|uniref:lipase n=1 Tax=Nocardia sp. NPDC050710 TaxID=3157220 RepID=UPI0033EFBA75
MLGLRRNTSRTATLLVSAAAALGMAVVAPPGAVAEPTPTLSVSNDALAAALHCSGSLADSPNTPVLFIHGATSNSAADFGWNWHRTFNQLGWSYCSVELPENGNGDMQHGAEYVVYALRAMSGAAGRPVSIVGHSLGGIIGRWALKYWPDTRALVDDYIGFASANHGSQVSDGTCASACSAVTWQLRPSSEFLAALNSGGETYPEVSYTVIATTIDEAVVPFTSSFLAPAGNVTNAIVQDVCPGETVEHNGLSYDNATWLIGLDALQHPGPADLSRVDRSSCGQPFMPGVNPITFVGDAAGALAHSVGTLLAAPKIGAEPALRPYAL